MSPAASPGRLPRCRNASRFARPRRPGPLEEFQAVWTFAAPSPRSGGRSGSARRRRPHKSDRLRRRSGRAGLPSSGPRSPRDGTRPPTRGTPPNRRGTVHEPSNRRLYGKSYTDKPVSGLFEGTIRCLKTPDVEFRPWTSRSSAERDRSPDTISGRASHNSMPTDLAGLPSSPTDRLRRSPPRTARR